MAAPRRKAFLPLRVTATTIRDRAGLGNTTNESETELATALGISSPGSRRKAERGVLSDFIVRPNDFMDEDVLQAATPPVENPLAVRSLPTTRSYRRPIIEALDSTKNGNEDAVHMTAGLPDGIVDAFPVHTLPQSDSAAVPPNASDQSASSSVTASITTKPQSAPVPPPRKFQRADYVKAMEPKVLLPYEARPGQTPRKIEIERRKRIYSSQNIGVLIREEIRAALGPNGHAIERLGSGSDGISDPGTPEGAGTAGTPVARAVDEEDVDLSGDFLPLEYFDDVEYDERTVWEWLNMLGDATPSNRTPNALLSRSNPQASASMEAPIHLAAIPVPAKALDGTKWRNCLVIAYDHLSGKWKIKWRKAEGWDYDRPQEDEENGEEDEPDEEAVVEGEDGTDSNTTSRNETWVHRYVMEVCSH